MAFFNKKEDVLDIQLTQYGKYLLSIGRLKPVYYAFFDDDIVYDSAYAGFNESHTETEPRIQNNTPKIKTQYVFSSREDEIRKINRQAWSEADTTFSSIPTPEKHYSLSSPIGSSDHADNAPAWNIKFLNAPLSGAAEQMTGSHPTLPIPQIDVDIVYTTEIRNMANDIENEFGFMGTPNLKDYPQKYDRVYSDGTYISVSKKDLMIEIIEENTEYEKENFDIELFRVEQEDTTNRIKTPGLSSNSQTKKENLIPLNFLKKYDMIQNDLLLDDPSPAERLLQENVAPIIDSTFAEYYFDIRIDHEISQDDLCAAITELKRQSIYIDTEIECPEEFSQVSIYSNQPQSTNVDVCDDDTSGGSNGTGGGSGGGGGVY